VYVSIEEVKLNLLNVIDCEVMHDYIVCLDEDGSYWATKQYQPKFDDVKSVPFAPAAKWMTDRFARLLGKGHGDVNDQLEDARIKDLATVSLEETRWTDHDFFGSKDAMMNEVMPGAFGNEYANKEFSL